MKSYKICTHNRTKNEHEQLWYICTQHGRIPPPPASLHAPALPLQRTAAVSKTMKEARVQEYLHQEY